MKLPKIKLVLNYFKRKRKKHDYTDETNSNTKLLISNKKIKLSDKDNIQKEVSSNKTKQQ